MTASCPNRRRRRQQENRTDVDRRGQLAVGSSAAANCQRPTANGGFMPDFIIIGSGFGGSVSACRLAQSGASVLVLERGRRWEANDYPIRQSWLFDPDKPEKFNGWLDFRLFGHMNVVQGAGIGGGSLVYANI